MEWLPVNPPQTSWWIATIPWLTCLKSWLQMIVSSLTKRNRWNCSSRWKQDRASSNSVQRFKKSRSSNQFKWCNRRNQYRKFLWLTWRRKPRGKKSQLSKESPDLSTCPRIMGQLIIPAFSLSLVLKRRMIKFYTQWMAEVRQRTKSLQLNVASNTSGASVKPSLTDFPAFTYHPSRRRKSLVPRRKTSLPRDATCLINSSKTWLDVLTFWNPRSSKSLFIQTKTLINNSSSWTQVKL